MRGRADQQAHGRADPAGGERPARPRARERAQDRRLLRELHGRGGHRGEGPRAAAADARPHRGDRRPAGARPRARRRRCAPTSTCSTPRTSTPTTCSASGSRRTSTTRPATRPSCCRAASACPTASTTSTPRRAWRRSARKYQAHIAARARRSRSVADARGQGRAHLRARAPDRRGAREPREDSEDVKKANNHWTRADFDTPAPGLDWAAYFAAAGLGAQPQFVVWQPSAVTGISALVGERAARRPGRTTCASTPSSTLRPSCREAFGDERFAFYGTVLAGTPQRREPLEAGGRRDQRRARRGGRPALRRALLPARGEGAGRGDGRRT